VTQEKKLVSIVVPCYNSEATVEELADETMDAFAQWPEYDCEMILVDDYSRDQTFEAIRRVCAKYPNVTGVDLAKNFGQHAAIMAGLHHVHGDYVVGMDDDLQNHPSQIRAFLDKAQEGYDVVFGVFRERKFSAGKNITGAISRYLLWHLLERPKDIQMSSFWLARRYVVECAKEYKGSAPFIQLLFFRTTYHMADIEIEHYARQVGQSNYTFRKGLRHFMSFINYTVLPLRLASILGVVFSAAGFIAGICVFIRRFIDPTVQIGWSSLMCAMFILFGFAFLMLGLIGEYIGKIVLMMNSTPQYVERTLVAPRDVIRDGYAQAAAYTDHTAVDLREDTAAPAGRPAVYLREDTAAYTDNPAADPEEEETGPAAGEKN